VSNQKHKVKPEFAEGTETHPLLRVDQGVSGLRPAGREDPLTYSSKRKTENVLKTLRALKRTGKKTRKYEIRGGNKEYDGQEGGKHQPQYVRGMNIPESNWSPSFPGEGKGTNDRAQQKTRRSQCLNTSKAR